MSAPLARQTVRRVGGLSRRDFGAEREIAGRDLSALTLQASLTVPFNPAWIANGSACPLLRKSARQRAASSSELAAERPCQRPDVTP